MKTKISLSKQERRQQFAYLLIMLLVAVIITTTLFFRNEKSPFSSNSTWELQMLSQRNKFTTQQKITEPLVKSTFTKIDVLTLQPTQPFIESDIKNSVNQIANSFENVGVIDSRKEGYLQIAKFYKMYFEDKLIASKKVENIAQFEKQFDECSAGFKSKEAELAQKKNAILSRSQ